MVGAIPTVLLAFAFVCALLATIGAPADYPHWKWSWASIMFLIAALLLGGPLQHLLIGYPH